MLATAIAEFQALPWNQRTTGNAMEICRKIAGNHHQAESLYANLLHQCSFTCPMA